jgi:hypothetical protein
MSGMIENVFFSSGQNLLLYEFNSGTVVISGSKNELR